MTEPTTPTTPQADPAKTDADKAPNPPKTNDAPPENARRRKRLAIPEGKVGVVTLLLTVKKKTSAVAVVAPEHEYQILLAIHGEDAVKIVDDTHGVLFLDDDAEAELQRLVKKYDDKTNRNVAAAFPTIQHLAAAAGMGYARGNLRRGPSGPQLSEQVDNTAKANKSDAQLLRDSQGGG